MKRVVAALCAVLLAANVFAQKHAAEIDFKQLEQTVAAELKERSAAGAAIAIIKDDKIVFAKGFGVANQETAQPITPDTLFQIGSITKTFTALAILGFAAEGKLKLDAPIKTYAKNLHPKIGKINFHQLLSHTGGLLDEPDEYGAQDESLMASYINSWSEDRCLFEPGETFSYSNSGFALAGFAMQEAVGKPFVDLMNERVFAPLAMTRTTFRPTVAMTFPLAVGHRQTNDKLGVVRPLPQDARLYPAGTFYTSANDLARFARAFLNDGKLDGKQIIAPAIIKQMSAPRAAQLNAARETDYGYGLFLDRSRGSQQVWHDGSMTGFAAAMRMFPENKVAVIVLSNTNAVALDKTREKAVELMLPSIAEKPSEPTAPQTMSRAEMQNLAGFYEQPKRWTTEILVKDDQLFIRQFNREMQLVKTGENRFSFEFPAPGVVQEIVFRTNADGKPVSLHQFVWAFRRKPAK